MYVRRCTCLCALARWCIVVLNEHSRISHTHCDWWMIGASKKKKKEYVMNASRVDERWRNFGIRTTKVWRRRRKKWKQLYTLDIDHIVVNSWARNSENGFGTWYSMKHMPFEFSNTDAHSHKYTHVFGLSTFDGEQWPKHVVCSLVMDMLLFALTFYLFTFPMNRNPMRTGYLAVFCTRHH